MKLNNVNTDYEGIKTQIEDYLKNYSDTLTAVFPGETSMIITEIAAGITAMLNDTIQSAHLNTFMPTAYSKSAINAMAMATGGIRRKVSSSASFDIEFKEVKSFDFVIPKRSSFQVGNYFWYNTEDIIVPANTEKLSISLVQGEITDITLSSTGVKYQYYYLGSTDWAIAEGSVKVVIQNDEWSIEKNSLIDYYDAEDKRVFLEQTYLDGRVIIIFGDGTYGDYPRKDTEISVSYAETVGAKANTSLTGLKLELVDSILLSDGSFLSCEGTSTTPCRGGDDEESTTTVKYTSPRVFAANKRAVRRDDYNGLLRRYPGVISANVWGEKDEENRTGRLDVKRMARKFYSVITNDLSKVSKEDLGNTEKDIVDYSLNSSSTLPIVPGSVKLKINDINFYDPGGESYLLSDEISNNILGGSTATSSGSTASHDADLLVDGDEDTYFESSSPASSLHPVFLKFSNTEAKDICAIRLRSVKSGNTQYRAFPKVMRVWASNEDNPDINDSNDWTSLIKTLNLQNPDANEWSEWISVLSDVPYKHFRLEIKQGYNSDLIRISELELAGIPESKVNYSDKSFSIKLPSNPTEEKPIVCDYLKGDIDDDFLESINTYLIGFKNFTHVPTHISSKAKMIDVDIDLYYYNDKNANNVRSGVETVLNNLFKIDSDSLSRIITISDIYRAITSVDGVDYVRINTPTTDVTTNSFEFVYLDTLSITLTKSER